MGWTYLTFTKENVSVEDMQKIVDAFPDSWFRYGESKHRSEKPVRQNWGWSTIVDIGLPWRDWNDDELGKVGVVTVGGAGFSAGYGREVNAFMVDELRKLGYTILKEKFSH